MIVIELLYLGALIVAIMAGLWWIVFRKEGQTKLKASEDEDPPGRREMRRKRKIKLEMRRVEVINLRGNRRKAMGRDRSFLLRMIVRVKTREERKIGTIKMKRMNPNSHKITDNHNHNNCLRSIYPLELLITDKRSNKATVSMKNMKKNN